MGGGCGGSREEECATSPSVLLQYVCERGATRVYYHYHYRHCRRWMRADPPTRAIPSLLLLCLSAHPPAHRRQQALSSRLILWLAPGANSYPQTPQPLTEALGSFFLLLLIAPIFLRSLFQDWIRGSGCELPAVAVGADVLSSAANRSFPPVPDGKSSTLTRRHQAGD